MRDSRYLQLDDGGHLRVTSIFLWQETERQRDKETKRQSEVGYHGIVFIREKVLSARKSCLRGRYVPLSHCLILRQRDRETARQSEVGYHGIGFLREKVLSAWSLCPIVSLSHCLKNTVLYLAYKQLGLPTRGSPIVIGVGICYQMITRSSSGMYMAFSSVIPKASYHDWMLRSVAFTRLRPSE